MKDENAGSVRAFNPATGNLVWEYPSKKPMFHSELLSTGGGLVFFETLDSKFKALDARTGKPVWEFNSGLIASAAPISYAALSSKDY